MPRAIDVPSKALGLMDARRAFLEALWKLRPNTLLELRNEQWSRADIREWAIRWHLSTPWLELWAHNACTRWRVAVEQSRDHPPAASLTADGDAYTYWERRYAGDPDSFFDLVTGTAQFCGGPAFDEHFLRELHDIDIARVVADGRAHEKESEFLDRVSVDAADSFDVAVYVEGPSPAHEDRDQFLRRALADVTDAARRKWDESTRGHVRSPIKPQLSTHAEWTVRSYVPPIESSVQIVSSDHKNITDQERISALAATVRKAVAALAAKVQLPRRAGGRPPAGSR